MKYSVIKVVRCKDWFRLYHHAAVGENCYAGLPCEKTDINQAFQLTDFINGGYQRAKCECRAEVKEATE